MANKHAVTAVPLPLALWSLQPAFQMLGPTPLDPLSL